MHSQILKKNNYTADDYAKEFGIKVNNQLALVDARVLPAPKVNVFFSFGVGNNIIGFNLTYTNYIFTSTF